MSSLENAACKYKNREKVWNAVVFAIWVLILLMLVVRIHFTISRYDEVFNIYTSFLTVVMGFRHLVENTMLFSMGDLLNLPVVSALYHITGKMDGIVLLVRYEYLFLNIILSIVFYLLFHKQFGKKICILFSAILIIYAPFSVYSVWYDSAALFFGLLGAFLLIGTEWKSGKTSIILRYFGGLCHACMVYAYPTMLLTILVSVVGYTIYIIKKQKLHGKQCLLYWTPYLFGGLTIVAIFLSYVFYVGWDNIFFLKESALESSLSGRILGDAMSATTVEAGAAEAGETAIKNSWIISMMCSLLEKVRSLLTGVWKQQQPAFYITCVLVVQWAVGLVHKSKYRLLILPEIILAAVWTHREILWQGQWSTLTMYAYYALWAPLLYFYIDKEERRLAQLLFAGLWFPAIGSFFAIGATALYDVKASTGLYCGAICTFLFMILLARKIKLFEYLSGAHLLIILVALGNLFMLYHSVYEDEQVLACTHRMQTGIYKGIMAEEKDAELEIIAEKLDKIDFSEIPSIYADPSRYMSVYIEGRFWFPSFAPKDVEQDLQSGSTEKYIDEKHSGRFPDVIVLSVEESQEYPQFTKYILLEKYELIYKGAGSYLYCKKDRYRG